MANQKVTVRFRGLDELDRALGKADKNLRKDLRDRLRDIAESVASEARSTVTRKGLVQSGDLKRGIRPFVRTGSAGVRSGAVHRGFEYPRRLEYENRAGGAYGPLASLNPAVDAGSDDLMRDAEQLLDHLVRDFSGGPLT